MTSPMLARTESSHPDSIELVRYRFPHPPQKISTDPHTGILNNDGTEQNIALSNSISKDDAFGTVVDPRYNIGGGRAAATIVASTISSQMPYWCRYTFPPLRPVTFSFHREAISRDKR
mmetsp:Transcript_25253/g.60717  ORF Transcript_25253/g.60717 Transcript_25253/m.60717 type:complete len:118 (+) Transcript_25253:102-455(+)